MRNADSYEVEPHQNKLIDLQFTAIELSPPELRSRKWRVLQWEQLASSIVTAGAFCIRLIGARRRFERQCPSGGWPPRRLAASKARAERVLRWLCTEAFHAPL